MPATAFVIFAGIESTIVLGAALVVAGAIDAYILGSILAPDIPDADLGQQNLNVRSADDPHKIVYGRTMTGGTTVLMEVLDMYYLEWTKRSCPPTLTEKRKTGTYLNMAIAIAAHEIDAVEEIYIGEDKVFALDSYSNLKLVNNKYANHITLRISTGHKNQVADGFITANIDKHYDGGTASELTSEAYYNPYGITDVDLINETVTIDSSKIWGVYPANYWKYDSFTYYTPDQGSDSGYTLTGCGSWDGNGIRTVGFIPSTTSRTEPVEGRPWKSTHRLTNTAYVYFRFKYNPDVYKQIPKVRCVIRGKKVYDPRQDRGLFTLTDRGAWASSTAYGINDEARFTLNNINTQFRCVEAHTSTNLTGEEAFLEDFLKNKYWEQIQENDNQSSWTWSDNWALCIRDYLTSGNYYSRPTDGSDKQNSLYGIGVKETELNNTNIVESANISDEIVYLTSSALTPLSSSYDSAAGLVTITLTGDLTDYYVKYEQLEIKYTGIVTTYYTWFGGYPVYGLLSIEDNWALSTLGPSISKIPFGIIDSYLNGDGNTVITYRANDDSLTAVETVRLKSTRFTLNGIVNTATSPITILENMLAAGAGKMPFAQGQYLLMPGVYIDPDIKYPNGPTITEDMLAGDITVSSSLGSANLINTITGTIKNPANYWEESDFPKQTSTTYITEDGGYELARSIKYTFVTSNFDAQRLARITLQRSRLPVSATLVCNLKALEIPIGDFIKVSIDRLGWDNEIFSVVSWAYEDNKVILSIRQENSVAYDWDNTTLIPIRYRPVTTFDPTPNLDPITNLTLTSGTATLSVTGDGTIVPRVLVTWTAPEQDFGTYLELTIAINGSILDVRTVALDPGAEFYYINNVSEGDEVIVYAVIKIDDPNLESITTEGGTIVESTAHTVVGKSEPPADVDALSASIVEDMVVLTGWSTPNRTTELDFLHYELREGTNWATFNWSDSTAGTELISTNSGIGTFNYFIKAIDTSGNESVNATSTILTTTPPTDPTGLTHIIAGGIITLSWTGSVKGSFSLAGYEIRKGGTVWDNAVCFCQRVTSSSFIIRDPQVEDTIYRVKAYDIYDNYSTNETTLNLVTTAPTPINPLEITHSIENDIVIINWPAAVAGSFPVSYYILTCDELPGFSAKLDTTTYAIDDNWIGDRTYNITVYDIYDYASASSSYTITTTAWDATTITQSEVLYDSIVLAWGEPTAGSFSLGTYEVRYGTDPIWTNNTLVTTTKSTSLEVPGTWLGSRNFRIVVYDIYGNIGTISSPTDIIISAPSTPNVAPSVTFVADRVEFTWDMIGNTGTFPVIAYEIRYDNGTGTYDAATTEITTSTDGFSRKVDWLISVFGATRRYWINPIDSQGNTAQDGTGAATTEATIVAHTATNITPQVVDNNVLLQWTTTTGTLPIDHYEVKKGPVYATADVIGEIASLFTVVFETAAGTYTYWVTTVDSAGNPGTSASKAASVLEPPDYAILANEEDDFVTVAATEPRFETRTFNNAFVNSVGYLNMPVDTTQTWESHFLDETDVSGTATSNNTGGTQLTDSTNSHFTTDMVGAKVTNTTTNATGTVTAFISSTTLTIGAGLSGGTPNNDWTSGDGYIISWNDIQDQIDAGFPIYIQNTPASAYYEFIYDYGATVTGTSVTATLTPSTGYIVAGDPVLTFNMSSAPDNAGSPGTWVDYDNDVYKVFIPSFRFIKCRLTITSSASDTDLVEFERIGLVLDIKARTDSGSGTITASSTATSADATGVTLNDSTASFLTTASVGQTVYNITDGSHGVITQVNTNTQLQCSAGLSGGTNNDWTIGDEYLLGSWQVFNRSFVDIESITITPAYNPTIEVIAVYDFEDVGNPEGFAVILLDASNGNKITGDFSWTVRGY